MADKVTSSGVTVMARVTISRQLKGEPGDSPAFYRIDVSPGAWMLDDSGKVPQGLEPALKVYKTEGTDTEDITGSWVQSTSNMFPAYKLKIIADGTEVALKSGYVVPVSKSVTVDGKVVQQGYKSIRIELHPNVGVIAGQDAPPALATFDCAISEQGTPREPGLPGPARAPLRITEWNSDPIGMNFYSGDKETDLWSDLVWSRETVDGVDKIVWGQCIQNFTRSTNETGVDFTGVLRNTKPCFRVSTQFDMVATDILLATESIIKNLIAEKVIAGVRNGQRIEIRPEQKAMTIYDSDSKECARFSGERMGSVAEAIPSAASWAVSTSSVTTAAGVTSSSTSQDTDTGWQTAANIVVGSTGGTTSVECTLMAQAAAGEQVTGGSGSAMTTFMRASVVTEARIVDSSGDVYDIERISAISNILDDSKPTVKNESRVTLTPVLDPNKTYYFQYRMRITYDNTGKSVYASAAVKSVIFMSASTPMYRARYFGNGWILSSSNTDYILSLWTEAAGMTFICENKNGYGFKIDNTGIYVKTKTSNGWKALQ